MTYLHRHVSEVPDSPVVECTTASVLEVVRAALNGDPRQPPATPAEREALRQASHAPDDRGASLPQLRSGVLDRYGTALPVGPLPDLEDLPDGTFLAVQGDMHAVGAHLKRFDPAFGARKPAPHCVCVFRNGGPLMWCDPLAPWGAYAGEPVSPLVVETYHRALPGAQAMTGRLRAVADPVYRVVIAGNSATAVTDVFDRAGGSKVGELYRATVTATRVLAHGAWWYRIDAAAGDAAQYRGRWFAAHSWMTATPAAGG